MRSDRPKAGINERSVMSRHHLKVTIDPNRCVTYGRCAAVAPGVFMIDEDTNKAYFDEDEIEEESL